MDRALQPEAAPSKMETTAPDLNRGDVSRKSVRVYSARKGLAPAPPNLGLATSSTTTSSSSSTTSNNTNNTSNNSENKNNNNNNNSSDSDNLPQQQPHRRQEFANSATMTAKEIDLSDAQHVDYDAVVELRRPGDIAVPPPRVAVSAIPALHLQSQSRPKVAPRVQMTAEDDVGVAFALGSIEKHILNVEESFKQQQLSEQQQEQQDQSQSSMDVVIRKQSKRYGETENLLRPGISDMSSENDFQYLGGRRNNLDDSNEQMMTEFQRGSDGRNSIGAYSKNSSGTVSGRSGGLKAKLARTASDTKNTDTVLAMRANLKQKEHQHHDANKQQQQLQQPPWRPANSQDRPAPTPAVRTSASRGNSSSSVVDGGSSSKLTATTISASKRREENLRQFEALLAQKSSHRHGASAAASGSHATTAASSVHAAASKRRSERPVVTPIPPFNSGRADAGPPPVEPRAPSSGAGHHRTSATNAAVTRTNVYGNSVAQVNQSKVQLKYIYEFFTTTFKYLRGGATIAHNILLKDPHKLKITYETNLCF